MPKKSATTNQRIKSLCEKLRDRSSIHHDLPIYLLERGITPPVGQATGKRYEMTPLCMNKYEQNDGLVISIYWI